MCAGWDPDPELASDVAAGRAAVVEPGLDEALRPALDSELLVVADDLENAMAGAAVTHLAYDTEVGPSGRADDPRLDAAVRAFAADAPDGALLLVSSQLPVGTCVAWRDLLQAQGRGLLLAHVPENLRLGRALEDFLHPDRVVVGADDDEAFERAADLLRPFSTSPMRVGLAAARDGQARDQRLPCALRGVRERPRLALRPCRRRSERRRSGASRRPAGLALGAAPTRAGVLGSDPHARPGHARESSANGAAGRSCSPQ